MEGEQVSNGEDKRTFAVAEAELTADYLLGRVIAILLVQDTHHAALVFPAARHPRRGHGVLRQVLDGLGKPGPGKRRQFHQLGYGEQTIGGRLERREYKRTLPIARYHYSLLERRRHERK